MQRGFSTIELIIALTLGSLIIGAVVQVLFGSQYWVAASETSGEALGKARAALESVRASARRDFTLASSSPTLTATSCAPGSLCYYTQVEVTDFSSCSKQVDVQVSWRMPGFSTSTTRLTSMLASPDEIIRLGSDCLVNAPEGSWSSMTQTSVGSILGTITAVDVLEGVAYVTTDTAPYFYIVKEGALVAYENGFTEYTPLRSLDVVRDATTGAIYAYVGRAESSKGLGVIEVTNPARPATTSMPLMLPGATNPPWRMVVYGDTLYIGTREGGTEFFTIDIARKDSPQVTRTYELNTSVYGLMVRTQERAGSESTLAFLATPSDASEVRVLDVTGGTITEVTEARTDLPGNKDGRSLFLLGNRLYVGLESGAGADLYVLNASVPFPRTGGLPVVHSAETSPRSVSSIRVSGERIYLTGTGGSARLEVRDVHAPATLIGTRSIAGIGENALDTDGNTVYVGASGALRLLTSP